MNWHRTVSFYPANTVVDPGGFHDGPDFIQTGRRGFYVWEDEGENRPGNIGRWTLHGPFRKKSRAEAFAAGMRP